MPGTRKLRPFVIQATLVAFGCSFFSLDQEIGLWLFSLLLSCYWLVLLGIAVHRFRWRGLWVLMGTPLALGLPYEMLNHFLRCYHRFCID